MVEDRPASSAPAGGRLGWADNLIYCDSDCPSALPPRFVMSTQTTFNVGMTCEGCANACKRILGKVEGVTEIVTDVEAKTCVVTHSEQVDPADMLAKLQVWSKASGKSVELAQ